MDIKFIEEIRDNISNKKIKSYCNKVLKKLNFKSSNDMQNLAMLAEHLYIFGFYEEVLAIADIVKSVEFTGDYTLWGEIEGIRAIEIRILREQNWNIEADNVLKTLVPYFDPSLYENQKKAFSIYDRNILASLENGSKQGAISWQLIKLGLMIQYYETPDFPIDKETLNEDIVKLKSELQTKIK